MYTGAIMKIVKPDLPPAVLEYKDRHVWPLKAKYETLVRRGNVGQIDARKPLIPALEGYVEFLAEFEQTPELEREAEWAERELADLRRLEATNMMKVPVIQGGRPPGK
jgi:hypothetical protein